MQAFALDFHFLVEQSARSACGYFTNFTGTAGVWRRTAIDDSGGWSASTLTEDLDLSYRAQLRGWRAAYLEDLVVPEELPVAFDSFRRQQSRWATGSFQAAFNLLSPVLRSGARPGVKFQAAMHLLAYAVGPVMLVQLACYPLLLLAPDRPTLPWQLADAGVLFVMMGVAPWIGFIVAQTRGGRPWWSGAPALLCQLAGSGLSFTVLLALVRARSRGGEFVRTPKYQIVEPGQEWRDQAYVRVGDPRALGEAMLGIGALAMVPFAAAQAQWLVSIYSGLFALGFLGVAGFTAIDLLQVWTLRSLGRRALARVKAAGPALGLLLICCILLTVAALMPEPFEDGYGHWLIAANLASTGNLHDPIFGMQDTWLPGYHIVAAAVLKVFGLWSMGALKVLGAMLGLTTLACVYALATNAREGRLAVALLVLNPVFMFTSGSTVAEPMLTALLTGTALAAVRGRTKLAAILAMLACVTATKAWIWIGAIGLVLVLETGTKKILEGRRQSKLAPAFAWTMPALAMLTVLQLGFAPATNSAARGSIEVASATARGSLADGSLARLADLTGGFGLAALPLVAFGLIGLLLAVRRPATVGGPAALRFLFIPALVYLAAVVGLVTAGVYTGSHRYLYPALPALALLAAAALNRHPAVTRLSAVAASGLLSIAFLPVFTSFANANSGLIAAGAAASRQPGLLVTDSPAAAFYSHKVPADIAGSQALPADRNLAIEWMRSHGVTAVVVEGISYYRATTLFPELAAGRASPPFTLIGSQQDYQVSNGKAVHVYRLPGPTAAIYPGVDAAFSPMPAAGKTAPLAKGLALHVNGFDVTGEGMGLGVPMVHYPDGWVYSRSVTTIDLSTDAATTWKRTFELDEIGVDAASGYRPIASRGAIEITYRVDSIGVFVELHVLRLAPGYSEMGILNELSASFDDFADRDSKLMGASLGPWEAVDGGWARLRSEALGVEWSVPALDDAQLHGGREFALPRFDWAGLDYMFATPPISVSYRITVQAAR
jgi:hypothetical protein